MALLVVVIGLGLIYISRLVITEVKAPRAQIRYSLRYNHKVIEAGVPAQAHTLLQCVNKMP
jgi:hypothetical protein